MQSAQATLTLCVHDYAMKSGPFYAVMKDYKRLAEGWGADIDLRVMSDATIARSDFIHKKCDMLFAQDSPKRSLNKFVSSIEAVGAAPSNRVTYHALKLLANPKLAPKMKVNGIVTLGAVPTGGHYFFVEDRNINTVSKFAGKKFVVYYYDIDQEAMVRIFGGMPVSANAGSIVLAFNNGYAEIIGTQLDLYRSYLFPGLKKGLGTKGAIIDLPFSQGIKMFVAHDSALSDIQVQQSREWIVDQLPKMFKLHKADKDYIEDRHWIKIDSKEKERFERLFRDLRMEMTDKGQYDPAMMKLLKKVRCQVNPSSFDCSLSGE